MRWTNKQGLPPELANIIIKRQHRYSKGGSSYSVTELLNSVRQVLLTQRYIDDIEEDVSDSMQAWVGQLIHDAVEDDVPRAEVKVNGIRVSGTADTFPINGHLRDWKTTSVWNLVYKSSYPKWEEQLNLYAYIYGIVFGWEVSHISVNAFLTDWQRSKAKFDKSYPQTRYSNVPLTLWPKEEQEYFLRSKVERLERWAGLPDDKLVGCTDEERWYSGDSYAVTKVGNKKASKVCSTEEEAQDWLRFKPDPDNFNIIKRVGENRKCMDYCSAAPFCNQWKKICGQ